MHEVELFACRVSVPDEVYADYLRAKLNPPGKACKGYYIDLATVPPKVTQEGEIEGFLVYTVDDAIVSVQAISPEW
jgi:hypothetical protein